MERKKCPICDHVDESASETPLCCPRCGTDFTGSAMEKRIMGAHGTYTTEDKQFFGKVSANAFICLTDRRLIAIPEKLEGFNKTTVLSAAVINKMTSKYGFISIPLNQIKTVRDGKFGLLAKAIIIDTADGGLLKITVPKQNDWKAAIINTVPS